MAKRHPALISLSHDHHHGLALALRLRQGDKALLNDGWVHDRREQATRVLKFYADELRPHFAAEEEALFPALQHHSPTSSDLIRMLINDHRDIERIVGSLQQAPDRTLEDLLVQLGTRLENHIRAEERQLFPIFEGEIPEHLAKKIGEDVERIHDRVAATSAHQVLPAGGGVAEKPGPAVLIVEDEPEIRFLLGMVFETENFRVYQANDGEEALRMLTNHLDQIVLMITDLGLPKVEGVELIQKARALKPSLKIIGASGFGRKNVHEEVLKAGGDEFVPKPFVTGELVQTARNLLGKG